MRAHRGANRVAAAAFPLLLALAATALVGAGAGGCSKTTQTGIAITVHSASSIGPLAKVQLIVSGPDGKSDTLPEYDVSGGLPSEPLVTVSFASTGNGEVSVHAIGKDASGQPAGVGFASTTLEASTFVPLTITIGPVDDGGPGDGGDGAGSPDGGDLVDGGGGPDGDGVSPDVPPDMPVDLPPLETCYQDNSPQDFVADCAGGAGCEGRLCQKPGRKMPGDACVADRECATVNCQAGACSDQIRYMCMGGQCSDSTAACTGGDDCYDGSQCGSNGFCSKPCFDYGSHFCGNIIDGNGCGGDFDAATCRSGAPCGMMQPNICTGGNFLGGVTAGRPIQAFFDAGGTTALFWMDAGGSGVAAGVYYNSSITQTTQIAALTTPVRMAQDAGALYVIDGTTLQRTVTMYVKSGVNKPTAAWQTDPFSGATPEYLAADATTVYAADQTAKMIVAIGKDTGVPTGAAVSLPGRPAEMVVAGNQLYFIELDPQDAAGKIRVAPLPLGSAPVDLSVNESNPTRLLKQGNFLYWINDTSGQLRRLRLTEGAQAETLASYGERIAGLGLSTREATVVGQATGNVFGLVLDLSWQPYVFDTGQQGALEVNVEPADPAGSIVIVRADGKIVVGL
jgi:hypothetical protein